MKTAKVELPVTVKMIAEACGVTADEVIAEMARGMAEPVTITWKTFLEPNTAHIIGLQFGYSLEFTRENR